MAEQQIPNGSSSRWTDGYSNEAPSQTDAGDDLDDLSNLNIDEYRAPADYYTLLNVPRDAPSSQIRAAYLKQSLHFHPDKQPEHLQQKAKARFEEIQRAYEVLTNPKKRHIYDRLGEQGLEGQWALGPRGLTEDEFKAWFDQQIRRSQMEEVDSLIRTSSLTTVGIMGYGIWQYGQPNKEGKVAYRKAPFIKSFATKQSCRIDLPEIIPLLETPFSSLWEKNKQTYEEKPKEADHGAPVLTLTAGMSGDRADFPGLSPIPVFTMGRPIVGAKISHYFPVLAPGKKASISTLLQGSSVFVSTRLYPAKITQVGLSRNVYDNSVTVNATFGTNPLLVPPTFSVQVARSLNRRLQLFSTYSSRQFLWPESLHPIGLGFGRPVQVSQGIENLSLGLSLLPKTVYSSMKSRTGQIVLKPERNGRSLTVALMAQQYQIPSISMVYKETFYPFKANLTWEEAAIEAEKERKGETGDEDPAFRQGKNGITLELTTSYQLIVGLVIGFNLMQQVTSTISLGVGYNITEEGAVVTATIARLKQRLTLPITVAPFPTQENILGAIALPLTVYALRHTPILKFFKRTTLDENRPLLRAKLEALQRHVQEQRQRYEEEVEMLRPVISKKAESEARSGGLVILKAVYGVPELTRRERSLLRKMGGQEHESRGIWVDVTIGVQNLTQQDQVVVGKRVKKAHLIGFYDPIPFSKKKVLRVDYLFRGVRHSATFADDETLCMPLGEHRVKET